MKGINILVNDPVFLQDVNNCAAACREQFDKLQQQYSTECFVIALAQSLGTHLKQCELSAGWSTSDQLLICARIEQAVNAHT